MKPLNKLQTFLLNAGGILLLVGAILPAIGALQTVAPYVFTLAPPSSAPCRPPRAIRATTSP